MSSEFRSVTQDDADGPSCRVCGCTDEEACEGGCIWAEPDLCSRCARPRTIEGYDGPEDEDIKW